MRKLRIAQIAPLWVSVPPKKYGGIELVVHNLTEELVRRGHDVTLFASGDSNTSAKLASVYPRALLRDKIPWRDVSYDMLNLKEAFNRADQFDIMHSHVDLWDQFFISFVKTPVVSTMHNNMFNLRENAGRIFTYKHFNKNKFISISLKQQKNDATGLNFIANVYNGLDSEKYKLKLFPPDKFIWIARIDEAKGVYNAILAANRLGASLDIAGRVDEAKEDFFKAKVKPYLNKKIRYIGEIGQKQKNNFFGNAKALLYPIEWEEPFGLVMIEAMACGTPVIAFDRGSVREIVEDGKTGFIVKPRDRSGKINIFGLVEAMEKADKIDRAYCRKRFEERFTTKKMADGYEEIYYKILKIKN